MQSLRHFHAWRLNSHPTYYYGTYTHTHVRFVTFITRWRPQFAGNRLIAPPAWVTVEAGEKNTLIEQPPPPTFSTPRRRALSARIQELNRSLLEEREAQNQNSSSDNEDSR